MLNMDDITELRKGMQELKEAVARIEICLMGTMTKPNEPGLVPEFNRVLERLIRCEDETRNLRKEVDGWKGTLNGVKIAWGIIIALAAVLIKFL